MKKLSPFYFEVVALLLLNAALPSRGQITIQPPFHTNYALVDLGSLPGVPANYGGMIFKRGDPQTLVIGGAANTGNGKFYAVLVVRGTNQHIVGFTNSAALFADGGNNDGGLAYGPGSVLFYTRYPNNEIGEIKLNSVVTDKVLGLSPRGVPSSTGGLNFVPEDFSGAGNLIICSYNQGGFYATSPANDGTGTYDFASVATGDTGFSGPEGFIFVPAGSPQFADHQSMLLNEYGSGQVSAFNVDTNGMPSVATRRAFITGLSGAEGAVIDPLTGDFLFSTYGGGSRIVVVQGFGVPLPADLEVAVSADTSSFPCQTLMYTVAITNHGPARATGIFVSDVLPPNAVLFGAKVNQGALDILANVISWNAGFLPARSSATLTMSVAFTQPGSMTNSVSAAANEGDSNPTNNLVTTVTEVQPIPAETLVIDRRPDGALDICWGTDNAGLDLQSATNLLLSAIWQPVTANISSNDYVKSLLLTNHIVPAELYFRLHKP